MKKQKEGMRDLVQQEYSIEENYKSTNPRARPKTIKYRIDDNGCWICTSHAKSRHRGNYPVIRRFNKYMRMSRYIYWLNYGEIDEDKYVMHLCDEPECINPSHLKLGTPKENSQDMVMKGRNKTGEDHPDAKLSKDDVIAIYQSEESCIKLAKDYGVSKKTILNIRHKRTWRKVLNEAFPDDFRWKRENRFPKGAE